MSPTPNGDPTPREIVQEFRRNNPGRPYPPEPDALGGAGLTPAEEIAVGGRSYERRYDTAVRAGDGRPAGTTGHLAIGGGAADAIDGGARDGATGVTAVAGESTVAATEVQGPKICTVDWQGNRRMADGEILLEVTDPNTGRTAQYPRYSVPCRVASKNSRRTFVIGSVTLLGG